MILTSRSRGIHQHDPLPPPTSPPPARTPPPWQPRESTAVPLCVSSASARAPCLLPSEPRGSPASSFLHLAIITYDNAPYGKGSKSNPHWGRSQRSSMRTSREGHAAARRLTAQADSCDQATYSRGYRVDHFFPASMATALGKGHHYIRPASIISLEGFVASYSDFFRVMHPSANASCAASNYKPPQHRPAPPTRTWQQ
ncbi:hypothetical protein Vretimale_5769 [Volvox reticuliferus]|uniref:Uncharacterized protein n=1 Tax=Volvox reticuliferus TaxID=1737510 RepID=A0A8J4G6D2_9CHLO|nr:hypothetical protein Vretifemale_5869 [Volvox reticuliferus]GIM00874.1 hypothetical protein Vretimale_5769 [Volvox reticuliferus]